MIDGTVISLIVGAVGGVLLGGWIFAETLFQELEDGKLSFKNALLGLLAAVVVLVSLIGLGIIIIAAMKLAIRSTAFLS